VKAVSITIELQVTDNATNYDVRRAAVRCLTDALHIYAEAIAPRPHRLTGGPAYTFGYTVAGVRLA
jgi:hypothetical protein